MAKLGTIGNMNRHLYDLANFFMFCGSTVVAKLLYMGHTFKQYTQSSSLYYFYVCSSRELGHMERLGYVQCHVRDRALAQGQELRQAVPFARRKPLFWGSTQLRHMQ